MSAAANAATTPLSHTGATSVRAAATSSGGLITRQTDRKVRHRTAPLHNPRKNVILVLATC